MLSQGKDGNEAGREKDKQETVSLDACEYKYYTGKTQIMPVRHAFLVTSGAAHWVRMESALDF